MIPSITFYKKDTGFIDKVLIFLILLIPLSLAISIFVADLLASISSLIICYKLLNKENRSIFISIKNQIIIFSLLYFIILISLILTNYKQISFLASFFYFRYFLLSISIFYLLKKYDFFFQTFFKIIIASILFVIFDALIQYFFGFNVFGYNLIVSEAGNLNYLSGFFNEEKKLGSYLVRFLPLILSMIYCYNPRPSKKFEIFIVAVISIVIFLASERTALFLLIIIYFFYLLITKKKILFLSLTAIIFISLFTFQKTLTQKYINFTLEQTGLILLTQPSPRPIHRDIVRYFSYEHENLSYTGLVAFKEKPLFGTGIKTFYSYCNDTIPKFQFTNKKRNNRMLCSTHPHNTYVQILSEIGMFGFLLVICIFFKTLFSNFKILITKENFNYNKSYYFINLSIIINIMPLIPSGSFFNNWICLIIFFPIGFWLYINDKIKR